jgi:hypothetical protein
MMTFRRFQAGLCAALTAAACWASPAQAEVSEAVAERVMRDSGMWQQVADIGPQLKQGFEQAALRPPADLGSGGAEGLQRLAAATEDAFGPLALRLAVRREVAARLDPQHLPALQAWLASPEGQRITAREVAKSAERGDSTARQQLGEQTLAASPPERRALLDRFMAVSRNAEVVSSTMLNMMLALQSGVARAMGRQDLPPLQDLRVRMEPQRQQMEQQLAPLVLSLAADMYAPISDTDLRAYVDFQASPPGQHFTEVAIRALDAAVAQSAEELGRLVAPR